MNALVGERMSIITNKPQTTRHRIIGLLNGDDFQIVFSDTPGVIENPAYKMQETMNTAVHGAFEDGDLMLLVTEPSEKFDENHPLLPRLRQTEVPVIVVLNKIDLSSQPKVEALVQWWHEQLPQAEIIPLSALHQANTGLLLRRIQELLPEGPAYYPKDQFTDRPERFFVSEIIREKILEIYHQEIPYSTEVEIESFKEGTTTKGDPIVRIGAVIYVSRKTQKPILIGRNGESIKKLSTEARQAIEIFLEQKVFLELFVKVKDNWRDDDYLLKQFGYA